MDAQRAPRGGGTRSLGLAEAVLDASPNAIIAVDARGRIIFASLKVEEAFGWAPKELVGESIEGLVPVRLAERHAMHRAGHRDEPTARPMGTGRELMARRRDGSEFPVEISLAPLRTRRGSVVIATVVDITARTSLKEQLLQANEELQHRTDDLEERGRELMLLAQLGELLESCETLEEAYGIIGGIAEPLFSGDAGALYALDPTKPIVEAVASWGSPPPARRVFGQTDCWALRRSRLHVVHEGDPELRCPHVDEPTQAGLLCEPLAAQSESLGLLHVQVRRRPRSKARMAALIERERLIKTLGEQVALALANIRLRSMLREQSSRDALTGLFNRRFMEESLDREVRRAGREGYGLGLIMADLDHFKQLNDAFGHTAGDAVLRGLGRYLLSAVRGGDVACRFGGEEFVIILPKASLADTQRRAEILREGAKARPSDEPVLLYPPATMSIGVAAYPDHGTTVEQLVLAADSALYRAKAEGRDRVAVAGRGEPHAIDVSAG